jgi:hypothetical protein
MESQIIKLYNGYFNRAADYDGLRYWMDEANRGGQIVDISHNFSISDEYESLYGEHLSNSDLIDKIYDNLFDRVPDVGGKNYWMDQLAGGVSPGRLVVDVMSGAQGNDKIKLENTITVSKDWTDTNANKPFVLADAQNAITSIGEDQGDGVNITFIDDALLPYQAILTQAMQAAWKQWGGHGRADIELDYINLESDVLAFANTRTELLTGKTAFSSNIPVTQTSLGNEITTGLDMNGDLPDGRITIGYPIEKFISDFDETTIFAHEIGHLIVFRTSIFDLSKPPSGTATSWDPLISFPTGTRGQLFFNGPKAMEFYGGPVPITGYYNATHPDGIGSIMDPFIGRGQVNVVGQLDILMAADVGVII